MDFERNAVKQGLGPIALITGLLLLGTVPTVATGAGTSEVAGKTTGDVPTSPNNIGATKAAHASPITAAKQSKPVDINRATKDELKQLPGLSDTDADKIIAGRPYGSKAWLVTNKILDPGAYGNIRKLIVAGQPYKDAGKNAAIYKKK